MSNERKHPESWGAWTPLVAVTKEGTEIRGIPHSVDFEDSWVDMDTRRGIMRFPMEWVYLDCGESSVLDTATSRKERRG